MVILLVDDDTDFRRGLAENLRDDGCEVTEYSGPSQVPSLAELAGLDLLIVDYLMDGENGLAFARRFHESHPRVPVLLMTAYSTVQMEEEVARCGFMTLLHKPIAYEPLHRIVTQLAATGQRVPPLS